MRTGTKWVVVAVTLLLIAYDVAALAIGGVDATISRVVLGWSRENPIIPFAVGVVCGHLWWSQRE